MPHSAEEVVAVEGCYWSVEDCGWRRVRRADALVTPWSGTGLTVEPAPHPMDADDLLRTRRGGPLPTQREIKVRTTS